MRVFGQTANGTTVHAVDLTHGDIEATIITLGARVQDLRLSGVTHSLTVGSRDVSAYENALIYHGPIIGPVVNRLNKAKIKINGKTHRLDANSPGGHTLHSGHANTGQRVWKVIDHSARHVVLQLELAHQDGGFPGNRVITARFDLCTPAALRLTIDGTTDAPTLMNLANHSYWNLDGTSQYDGHSLMVHADHWLPTDKNGIPTGKIQPVDGTEFDYRAPRLLNTGLIAIDHNFCLSKERQPLRKILTLTGKSGVHMTLSTTEPGVQIYDGRPGYEAIAIEAQGWPDAPTNPDFPSIIFSPEQPYQQKTEWQFDRR